MRAVVQRVSSASVSVDGAIVGSIGAGICILLGAGPDDTEATARHLAGRIATLRIHGDDQGRMNLDLVASGGAALVISQFTLYADTRRGHRPSFLDAAPPQRARPLCDQFCTALRGHGVEVAQGVFGAQMSVRTENAGPVTVVLSSGEASWGTDAG